MTKSEQIKSALDVVEREIWIVTAADEARRSGLVATWVSSASIDVRRPVLLAALAPNHFTTELVQSSKAFAAHLLRPEQTELAWNFACDSGRTRDKFADLEVESDETGSPILTNCNAWFDCRVFARYDAGDRLFFWADVVAGNLRKPSSIYALNDRGFFASLTEQQRKHLEAARDADAAHLRPLHEKWRLASPW